VMWRKKSDERARKDMHVEERRREYISSPDALCFLNCEVVHRPVLQGLAQVASPRMTSAISKQSDLRGAVRGCVVRRTTIPRWPLEGPWGGEWMIPPCNGRDWRREKWHPLPPIMERTAQYSASGAGWCTTHAKNPAWSRSSRGQDARSNFNE